MMQIEFAWPRRDEVVKAVEKLGRRAAKLGTSFMAEISTEVTRRVPEIAFDPFHAEDRPTGRVFEYGEITLITTQVAFAGWRLVGVLTPIPVSEVGSETILYPSAVPGEVLPEGVREWTQQCDHCRTVRRRLETFIVRHIDGEVKQVGRNCIRDFLGHDADKFLANFTFWNTVSVALNEENFGYGGRVPEVYYLNTILAATSAVVRAKGWVSANAARAYAEKTNYEAMLTPTKSLVDTYLYGRADKETIKFREEVGPITDADNEAVDATLEFWEAEQGTSDYVQNAKLLVAAGRVVPRAFGLAVSLLPVAQGNIAKRAVEAAQFSNRHVGVIDERSEFEVEVMGRRDVESAYGVKVLVTFRTRDGALIKWWATGDITFLPPAESGEFITVMATVKAHGEYKGRMETTVNRVALPPARKRAKR